MSVNFTPVTVGALTANLQVADNATGSPQALVLNGPGIAPAPAVTFSPSALTFPSTNQGTSSAPQTLTVISSGNAALNISSVSLAGPNPADFSFTSNCTTPLAPGSNCAISLILSAAIFYAALVSVGCGGGSAASTPPPPVLTPSGTSTITISLSATSSTGQPLQLQPIQLTLTVK